jgi:predicted nuclease with TOPRIM domain
VACQKNLIKSQYLDAIICRYLKSLFGNGLQFAFQTANNFKINFSSSGDLIMDNVENAAEKLAQLQTQLGILQRENNQLNIENGRMRLENKELRGKLNELQIKIEFLLAMTGKSM